MRGTVAFTILTASLVLARRGDKKKEAAPCDLKAWVRAEDLRPNAVSHGELKVKLVQPCADVVKSVALRLRLDELSEYSSVANTTSEGELWDWSGATPSQDWSVTKHKRMAFKTEKTLSSDESLKSENWEKGVVFPFTVASPNVNYPPAIFPLMFQGRNSETHRSSYGRLYRYVAVVQATSATGDLRTVEVPAGFTSFIPIETTTPAQDVVPQRVAVTAVESSRHVQSCKKSKADQSLDLIVTLHNGSVFTQDADYIIETTMQSRVSEANGYSVSATLEQELLIDGEPVQPVDKDVFTRSVFWTKEIYSEMTRPSIRDERFSPTGQELSTPFTLRIPRTHPRSTPSSAGDAPPFRAASAVVITVTEVRDFAGINPLQNDGVWSTGDDSKKEELETGWEFGDCDISWNHQRTYVARVPVTILGRPSDSQPESPLEYLANGDKLLAPRIFSGHVTSVAPSEFELARPVTARDTTKTSDPSRNGRDYLYGFGGMQSIDAKAGQYVGALWFKKTQGERFPLPQDDVETQSDSQTVLSARAVEL